MKHFQFKSLRSKLVGAFLICASITLIMGALGHHKMTMIRKEGLYMIENLPAWDDAANKIHYNLTTAFLHFKEIMAGDTRHSIKDVLTMMAEAVRYSHLLTHGGRSEHGSISPIPDPEEILNTDRISKSITELVDAMKIRHHRHIEYRNRAEIAGHGLDSLHQSIQKNLDKLILNFRTRSRSMRLAIQAKNNLTHALLSFKKLPPSDGLKNIRSIRHQAVSSGRCIDTLYTAHKGLRPAISLIQHRHNAFLAAMENGIRALSNDHATGSLTNTALDKQYNQIIRLTKQLQHRVHEMIHAGLRRFKADSNYLLKLFLIISLVGLIISLFIGLRISRYITNPIQNLAQTSESLAGGNLEARADPKAPDELGTLAKAFNHMADSLGAALDRERSLARKTAIAEAESKNAETLRITNEQLRMGEQQLKIINQQLVKKEEALQMSELELTKKVSLLERANKVMLGREMDMINLKHEVNSLLKESGKAAKYQIAQKYFKDA